jgi:hypothetical protein
MAPIRGGFDHGQPFDQPRAELFHEIGPGRKEVGGIEIEDLQVAADRPPDNGQPHAARGEPPRQFLGRRPACLIGLPGRMAGLWITREQPASGLL